MRAVRCSTFGNPRDVLRLEHLPSPEPAGGQVRIRFTHRPINPSDLLTVKGDYRILTAPPLTPGLEGIGVTRDYVKPGDNIKVRCHLLKDGSNGCLLGFLKAKDGTVKDWDGNNATLPTDF